MAELCVPQKRVVPSLDRRFLKLPLYSVLALIQLSPHPRIVEVEFLAKLYLCPCGPIARHPDCESMSVRLEIARILLKSGCRTAGKKLRVTASTDLRVW